MESRKMEFGIQLWPWYDLPTLVGVARSAVEAFPFDQIWMCDEFQYEDTLTTLAAMAQSLDVSLGTMVTFPWRNPLELAQRFASVAKLPPKGRHVAAGIGAGGAVQELVMSERTSPMKVLEETVSLLRSLLGGEAAALSDYPKLTARFRYNEKTKARLYFPPDRPVPVVLGAGGPRTCRMAGRLADGVILTQIHARTSATAMRHGLLDAAVEGVEEGRKGSRVQSFKRIYNLHFSVSADGRRARDWAKRNTSYGVATFLPMYPDLLKQVGVDAGEAARVREAFIQGLGVEEAARRVSDAMLERAGYIIAGTPEDCLKRMESVVPFLKKHRFDHLVIGVPLGPDLSEAVPLIAREILPALKKMMEPAA